MSQILTELVNKELLGDKIKELEQNYVNALFQEYYFPLTNEALAKEVLEMEDEPEPEVNEASSPEEKKKVEAQIAERAKNIEDRKKMMKTNEMQIKAIAGTIQHLNATLPFLKSFL